MQHFYIKKIDDESSFINCHFIKLVAFEFERVNLTLLECSYNESEAN